MTSSQPRRPVRLRVRPRSGGTRPSRTAAAALILAVGAGAGLCSCGGGSGGSTGGTASSAGRQAAERVAVQASRAAASAAAAAGALPSAAASKVVADASALRSAAASLASSGASAAVSSISARASAFEASVSADIAQASSSAAAVLGTVRGRGNALGDVTLTGLATANTSGLRAVVVRITNSSSQTASYAVQVDFDDSSGKVVEKALAYAHDVPPGGRANPVVFSRTSAQETQPRVAKAERY